MASQRPFHSSAGEAHRAFADAATTRTDGRATYAADARLPGRRLHPEAEPNYRSAFQRDRDRLLHSIAFRRLAGKTQVLDPREGRQHRTRLTHTLEVAQISRSLARALRLDEDLAEALALAHDFGHGPFGHTGEAALDAVLQPWGGFDHNVQSLRIVIDLERRYLDFDGLNLTWTTLEGLAKRKGPCGDPPALLRDYDRRLDLRLDIFPSAEAQVAAVADDIAYNAHDLEDGLLAGFFTLGDLAGLPLANDVLREVTAGRGDPDPARLPFALARGLIDRFVTDAIVESGRRLAAARPGSVEELRALDHAVIGLSPALGEAEQAIKNFLFANLYRHGRLRAVRQAAHDRVARLTRRLVAAPALLPADWACGAGAGPAQVARAVADYVAGLTDQQADDAYRLLFDAAAEFI